MIEQGLTLTVIGMAIVFIFLALLVVVMMVLSGVVRRISAKEQDSSVEGKQAGTDIHGQEIAAAAAAASAAAVTAGAPRL